jgi:hypothetical protein
VTVFPKWPKLNVLGTGTLDKHLNPASVYRNIVVKYGRETGVNAEVNGLCVHSMSATAATNALSNEADIAVAERIRQHDDESWIREWASIAESVNRIADRATPA